MYEELTIYVAKINVTETSSKGMFTEQFSMMEISKMHGKLGETSLTRSFRRSKVAVVSLKTSSRRCVVHRNNCCVLVSAFGPRL